MKITTDGIVSMTLEPNNWYCFPINLYKLPLYPDIFTILRLEMNVMMYSPVFIVLAFVALARAGRLSVCGTNLIFNGSPVFLSGVNFAWNSYGYDFGNGQYAANSKATFTQWLSEVATNGGNSVRVWVHTGGGNTPNFDSNGYTLGMDRTGTMIADMKQFLDTAKSFNILVTFVLWNGAVSPTQNVVNLFWDTSKLQRYIDLALTPMVKGLAGHPALAAWDIINEPEGLVYNNKADANSCFDTTRISSSGAGWVGTFIPMNLILQFVNWQADAINKADPGALVTVGSWSQNSQTDAFSNTRNYFSDACLLAGGKRALGKLDFYQMHTYAPYSSTAPFNVFAVQYLLNKPIVMGEFSAASSGGQSIQTLYTTFYNKGYAGAWGWQYAGGTASDSRATLNSGMLQLKGKTSLSIVNFPVV